jgi:hypothetical protein
MRRTSCLIAVVAIAGLSARAVTHAGMITDDFSSYPANSLLVGQGGWVAYNGVNSGAATITADGRAAITGTEVGPYKDFYGGFYYLPVSQPGLASVLAEVDLQLVSDPADPPDLTINGQLYSLSGNPIAGIYVTIDGQIIWTNNLDEFGSTTVELGMTHHLSILVDFASSELRYFLNDSLLGSLAYTGSDRDLGDFDISLSARTPITDSIGYFDNYSVSYTAVPEPSSALLLGVGVSALAAFRGLRARSRH